MNFFKKLMVCLLALSLLCALPPALAAGSARVEHYTIYGITYRDLICYGADGRQVLTLPDSTPTYLGRTLTTLEQARSSLSTGDLLHVRYDENGRLDWVVCSESTVVPTVSDGNEQAALAGYTVLRDGRVASASAVQPYDVVYRYEDMKCAFVYSTKVSGTLEKAAPNAAAPTSVTVAGKEYALDGAQAFLRFADGSISLGDNVTLLLGQEDRVVDVLSAGQITQATVGYVTDAGSRTFTDDSGNSYSSWYAELVAPSGEVTVYQTAYDCSSQRHKVVTVSFTDSGARLTSRSSTSLSGKVNSSATAIGSRTLSPQAQILDVSTTDKDKPGLYAVLYPQRLAGLTLEAGDVLWYEADGTGAITKLILRDVTGDMYDYGVLTDAQVMDEGFSVSASYTYDIQGVQNTIAGLSRTYPVTEGQPIRVSADERGLDSLTALTRLDGFGEQLTLESVTVDGTVYPLGSEACVYVRSFPAGGNQYTYYTVDALLGLDQDFSLSVYVDAPIEDGGRVRVILATPVQ